jgi:hypothetical protein
MDHWSLTMRAFRAPWHPSDAMDEKGPASRAETGRVIDRRDSSRGATFVAIMQATDLWERDDLAGGSKLDAARVRAILV